MGGGWEGGSGLTEVSTTISGALSTSHPSTGLSTRGSGRPSPPAQPLHRDARKAQLILPNQKQGPGDLVAHMNFEVRLSWAASPIFNIRGSQNVTPQTTSRRAVRQQQQGTHLQGPTPNPQRQKLRGWGPPSGFEQGDSDAQYV